MAIQKPKDSVFATRYNSYFKFGRFLDCFRLGVECQSVEIGDFKEKLENLLTPRSFRIASLFYKTANADAARRPRLS